MEGKIENKLSMMREVKDVCDKNLSVITTIPALNTAYTDFLISLSLIDQTINQQIKEIKGITADKLRTKEELIAMTDSVASAIMAYASHIHNAQLEVEVRFSPGRMIKMRDDLLINICENIFSKANDNISELGNYGVDATTLAAFQAAIFTYQAKCPEPKEARDLRKVYTEKLNKLMKDTSKLLKKEVDRLIHALPAAHADFKQFYTNSRNIIDYHGKRNQTLVPEIEGTIEGMVTAAFDGSPVEGAVISIDGTGFTAETNENGEYYLEKVPVGIYILVATAETYRVAKASDVEILDGSQLSIDFSLEAEV